MKLPDFDLDSALNALREQMGAVRIPFEFVQTGATLTLAELEMLGGEGIEIPLDDVKVLQDGTLAYKDRRVVLYIRDVRNYGNAVKTEDSLSRFHVADCDKLHEMRNQNRYGRYVVSTRDTGEFSINVMSSTGVASKGDFKLRVCQLCLGKLDWENFRVVRQTQSGRRSIVLSFELQGFFAKYPKALIGEVPKYMDETAPVNIYPDNWPEIRERIRMQRGFRCEECRVDLSSHRRFLHLHHRNAQMNENEDDNLVLLCIEHHVAQPSHGHMRNSADMVEFLDLLRSGHIARR